MIEALETGERALIPYRWEQIGSKHLTSSQMQRRSSHNKRGTRRLHSVEAINGSALRCRYGRPPSSQTKSPNATAVTIVHKGCKAGSILTAKIVGGGLRRSKDLP